MKAIRSIFVVEVIDHEKTGQMIRRLRKNHAIEADELAKFMGIGTVHLRCLEAGDLTWTDALVSKAEEGISSLGLVSFE